MAGSNNIRLGNPGIHNDHRPGRGLLRITWRIRVTRSYWYPRGYRILRLGQILHANPGQHEAQIGQKAEKRAAVSRHSRERRH